MNLYLTQIYEMDKLFFLFHEALISFYSFLIMNLMKLNPEGTFRKRIFAGVALVSTLLWALSLVDAFLVPDFFTGVPTAWASNRYGILGQLAPDLNLAHWIDGDGKKTQPTSGDRAMTTNQRQTGTLTAYVVLVDLAALVLLALFPATGLRQSLGTLMLLAFLVALVGVVTAVFFLVNTILAQGKLREIQEQH